MECGRDGCDAEIVSGVFPYIKEGKVKWRLECESHECHWKLEIDRETARALNEQVAIAWITVIGDAIQKSIAENLSRG